MAAMLVWGKGFESVEVVLASGEVALSFMGIGGGQESIAWSSVTAIELLAERHGVSRESWPVYRDCDVESEVPVEDAQRRSGDLRIALSRVDPSVSQGDHWLGFVHRILQDGNCFYVMI